MDWQLILIMAAFAGWLGFGLALLSLWAERSRLRRILNQIHHVRMEAQDGR